MLINKLTTAFGDHSSLLPLFAKDVVNSTGMTAFSYDAGGKIEAKDRCWDEFGTMAIWMRPAEAAPKRFLAAEPLSISVKALLCREKSSGS